MNRNKYLFPALLALFWVVTLVIVYPVGNFPLDDDWQYGRPVWAMISEGHYASTDSYSPILIVQAFWGLLFCLPFGFSFTALRISTLVLSLFGVILFYYLLLRLSKNQKMSFLGALLLAANPLYIILSCTFMTDIPFLALAMLSVYFFFKAIDSDKTWPVVLATFFSMLAVLIRQFGVVIPLAYAVVMMFKNKPKISKGIVYFIPAAITAITLEAGLLWLKYIGAELKPYRNVPISDFLKKPIAMFTHSIDWGSHIFTYSGFFLLPLLAYVTWGVVRPMSKRRKIVMASFIVVLSPAIILCCLKVFSGNIISTYGVGPRTLRGFDDIVYPNPDFPVMFLILLQLIAFCGAVMFLINMGKLMMDIIEAYMHKSFSKAMYKQIYILLFMLGYAILIFIPDFFFDRYLLVFMPLTTILLLANMDENTEIKKRLYTYCLAATLLMGFLSSAMVHDYFAWNRARWEATDYLVDGGPNISENKIDGGYEFNGRKLDREFPWNPRSSAKRSWWDVDDDEYVVAFNNFKGYTIIKQMPYQNFIPFETKNIYILHRLPQPKAKP
jgi:hypothetical protein